MRISGIFNNNFSISSMGINAKQKTNGVKKAGYNAYRVEKSVPQDVFINRDTAFGKEYREQMFYDIPSHPFVHLAKMKGCNSVHGKKSSVAAAASRFSFECKFGKPYRTTFYQKGTEEVKSVLYDNSFHIVKSDTGVWDVKPEIKLQRFGWDDDGNILLLKASPATENSDGYYTIEVINKKRESVEKAPNAEVIVHPNGKYEIREADDGRSLAYLKKGLEELSEIISQDECKKDFGNSEIFNDGLDDVIEYLSINFEAREYMSF